MRHGAQAAKLNRQMLFLLVSRQAKRPNSGEDLDLYRRFRVGRVRIDRAGKPADGQPVRPKVAAADSPPSRSCFNSDENAKKAGVA